MICATDTEVIFTPATEELRFLPEGPYRCPDGRISWVAIQHGPQAVTGSLNLLDLATGQNQTFPLDGRPGFAFPTTRAGVFVVGLERSIVLFDTADRSTETLVTGVDEHVDGTIINDAVVYDGHLVFGCKDLRFAEKKAGLYLLRAGQRQAIALRRDQVCSNGKAIARRPDGVLILYDICSHSKQVVAWQLNIDAAAVHNPQVVV
jgi:sugar lactone lactonase YvrE